MDIGIFAAANEIPQALTLPAAAALILLLVYRLYRGEAERRPVAQAYDDLVEDLRAGLREANARCQEEIARHRAEIVDRQNELVGLRAENEKLRRELARRPNAGGGGGT